MWLGISDFDFGKELDTKPLWNRGTCNSFYTEANAEFESETGAPFSELFRTGVSSDEPLCGAVDEAGVWSVEQCGQYLATCVCSPYTIDGDPDSFQLDTNDDDPSCEYSTLQSTIVFLASENHTYAALVEGFLTNEGQYELSVEDVGVSFCVDHADCTDVTLPLCTSAGVCTSCFECRFCSDGIDGSCSPCDGLSGHHPSVEKRRCPTVVGPLTCEVTRF